MIELIVYQGHSGKWIARRAGLEGHGKTKKQAKQDLEETEMFLRIAKEKPAQHEIY